MRKIVEHMQQPYWDLEKWTTIADWGNLYTVHKNMPASAADLCNWRSCCPWNLRGMSQPPVAVALPVSYGANLRDTEGGTPQVLAWLWHPSTTGERCRGTVGAGFLPMR